MTSLSLYQILSVAIVATILLALCQADICPDHKKTCRKGQTCCRDQQQGYGCCPYENATCCSDGVHCCPEETTCDLSAGRCRRTSDTVKIKQAKLVPISMFGEWSEAENELESDRQSINSTLALGDKKDCPDQKSTCPSTYTCCLDSEESYACCPYQNAVCCSDRIHCCPKGSKCSGYRCAEE